MELHYGYFSQSDSYLSCSQKGWNPPPPVRGTSLRVLFSKWQLLIMFPKRVRKLLSDLSLLSSMASKLLKGDISFVQTNLSLIWQWFFNYRNNALIFPFHTCVYELIAWLLMSSFSLLFMPRHKKWGGGCIMLCPPNFWVSVRPSISGWSFVSAP